MKTLLFNRFQLYPEQRRLFVEGRPVRLGSRALDILITLADRAGEVVSKEELLARVWPGTIVEESSLRVHVSALRKSIGDGRDGARYIANVPGRGYSFVAPVKHAQSQRSAGTLPERVEGWGTFPAATAGIVGRADVIATLTSQLTSQRLVTLVGSGGIGKTTVALSVAERLLGSYKQQACFVDLASLSDPALVANKLATALAIPAQSDSRLAVAASADFLRDKQMLIVLDNCEHVVEAAATLAEEVLKAAPGVSILATSREPLRAAAEWVQRLSSLEVPPANPALTAVEALRFAAFQLFVASASAGSGTFVLADEDVAAISRICRRLDGIPLALELAAATVDVFGVHGLAARLDESFFVLARGRRTALPRHQTLKATLDWSYNILSAAEQTLLRRVSVFAGAFSLEAASAVSGVSEMDELTALNELSNLVAKSLIEVSSSAGSIHYRLLDVTRAYALEKLTQSGEHQRITRLASEFPRSSP
jgi:predicted ATPase/DNA-binding winged helix-turn-helix (wHTH) protein